MLDGSMSLEDVEELLGTNVGPEEDYDTISGLITDVLDRIPSRDEHPTVRIGNVEILPFFSPRSAALPNCAPRFFQKPTNRKSIGRRIKIIIP